MCNRITGHVVLGPFHLSGSPRQLVVDDDSAEGQRPSWRSARQTSETSCPSTSRGLFDAGHVGVHSGWADFTHSYALRRRGLLCCRWAAMSGDADANLQNAKRWKPCYSYRGDDAVASYRHKTSPCVSGYRVRLVSAADNANGDGTSAEARFVQIEF